MGNVLVGTSSWSDKSLIETGRFYPASVTRPEERLRYYASQFPIVEIDSSYGIPTVENARQWAERTPPHFVFDVKACRRRSTFCATLASWARSISSLRRGSRFIRKRSTTSSIAAR